jgi:hypothetical protein
VSSAHPHFRVWCPPASPTEMDMVTLHWYFSNITTILSPFVLHSHFTEHPRGAPSLSRQATSPPLSAQARSLCRGSTSNAESAPPSRHARAPPLRIDTGRGELPLPCARSPSTDELPTVASSSSSAVGHELVARDVEHAEALDPPERLRQLAQLTINEVHALHRLPLISGR